MTIKRLVGKSRPCYCSKTMESIPSDVRTFFDLEAEESEDQNGDMDADMEHELGGLAFG